MACTAARDATLEAGRLLITTDFVVDETLTLTGEVIFLTKGTKIAYEAAEDDTEVVYVTFPHWMDAHTKSEHAHLLDSYHPV